MTDKKQALVALEQLCEYAFNCYGPRSTRISTPKEIQDCIETIKSVLNAAPAEEVTVDEFNKIEDSISMRRTAAWLPDRFPNGLKITPNNKGE